MRDRNVRAMVFAGCAALILLNVPEARAGQPPVTVVLGASSVALTGPWRFRTGDSPQWADPAFDDSGWESVDLTPLPDANDGDVGLSGYVSGWTSRGHAGYQGYAWYRMHLTVVPPAGAVLALLGPWAVDSVYQAYVNGKLVGGVGDFSGRTPTAHGYHYPTMFALPPDTAGGGVLAIAIRVWMGPWAVAQRGAGGIHIAPAIGLRGAIAAEYRLEWLKIFEGYAVDAVPALLFLLMAVVVLCLQQFDPADKTYRWLAAALVLSAIQRGNQAFFFWWRIETVQEFVYLIIAFVGSLSLAAWAMAWRSWFRIQRPSWLPQMLGVLTALLVLAQLLARPWLFHNALPDSVALMSRYLVEGLRLAFLVSFAIIIYQGVRRDASEGCYALPAALAIGVVLFAGELSAVRVPGIWFPWGVGLSLSECASVGFDALLFILLVRRLRSYARRGRVGDSSSNAVY
jgi:hypothetical protein